jgi:hypothetical protein
VWLLLSWVVPVAIGAGCVTYASSVPPRPTRVTFYEELSPYGEWFEHPPYGPVWRPHRHVVGVEFTPYVTGGRWVYTEYGWVFDTDWRWGWAPFHYGRWLYLGAVEGWVWVPDTVWGPAWVEWRAGGGYVGWAPLPPARVSVVIGVYEPRWAWVTVHHFQGGLHRGHVVFEPGVHPATSVIPPRPAHDGHAWYVGPSPDWVAHEASTPVTPRRYSRPEPLPPGASAATPSRPPPPGREHGPSQPPSTGGQQEHGASPPPPGRPAHGANDPH